MPKVCPVCDTVYPDANAFCPVDGTTLHVVDLEGGLIGSVVADRYLVTDLLGEGGMGKVYLARHVRLPQQAAIKVLRPEMVKDPAAVARFNREASNASRIDDENVARVYDFGEASGGTVYLAMEYVNGISLGDLIERDGPMAPRRAAAIVEQIGKGLDAAHRLKIIHRDLKPDNILVIEGEDGRDRVKVVDFGIAKAFGAEEGNLTKTGFVVGTPQFMSPEQLTGAPLDARSDVYALALVAFQCLTAQLPFRGDTPEQSMTARLMSQPRRLDEVSETRWSPAVQGAFDAGLSREASKRPESAGAFARMLATALDAPSATGGAAAAGDPARIAPASPVGAGPTPAGAATGGDRPPVARTAPLPAAKEPRGRGALVGAIAAGVVVVAAVGGYLSMRGSAAEGGREGGDQPAPPPAPAATPAQDTPALAAAIRDSIAREMMARDSAARAAVARQPASVPPANVQPAGVVPSQPAPAVEAPSAPPAPASVEPSLRESLDSLSRALGRRGVDAAEAARIAGALRAIAPKIPDASLRATAYFRLIQASVLSGDLTGACSAYRGAKSAARGEAQLNELRRFEEALGCG